MKRLEVILCCCVIVFGLLIAGLSALQRIKADQAFKEVMVLVDWQGLAGLAPESIPQPAADKKSAAPPAAPPAVAAPAAASPTAAPSAPATSASGTDATPAATKPPAPAAHAGPQLLTDEHWLLLHELPEAMICYGEETVGSLVAQGILFPARQYTERPAYEVAAEHYADDIFHGAVRHGYYVERSAQTGGKLVLELPDLPAEDFSLLPVGWLSDVRQAAWDHGVGIVLRPSGSEFLGQQGIARTFDFASHQSLMLFQGPTVLGFPGELGVTADELRKHRMRFGWVEFDEQDGGAQLAAKVAPFVVRVHSIPPEEMMNYDVQTAVARLLRAARERDVRCLYLRPFIRGGVIGDTAKAGFRERLFEVNRQYFGELGKALREDGFSITRDAPIPPPGPGKLLDALRRFGSAWAAGAAAILLLQLWFSGWRRWVWWMLRILNVLGAVAAIRMEMAFTPYLLLCALAFPLLGFWLALWLYQHWVQPRKVWCPWRLVAALACLALASVISALGGLLIHGGMWDAATMVRVGQFRGVTLALGLPVLLLAAYSWHGESLQDAFDRATWRLMDYWQRFKALWHAPIRYGDVAFIAIALGALAIVLLRSGNDSPLEVLNIETWFRGSLEQIFAVRPRTKELLGHPLFVIFLMSIPWRNRLTLLFGLAALLGQVSILNTFCHLHTPLLLTVQRVGIGLALGLFSGALWGLVIVLVSWIWTRLRKRSEPAG